MSSQAGEKGSKSPDLHGLKKDYETAKMQCASVKLFPWNPVVNPSIAVAVKRTRANSLAEACKYFRTKRGLS